MCRTAPCPYWFADFRIVVVVHVCDSAITFELCVWTVQRFLISLVCCALANPWWALLRTNGYNKTPTLGVASLYLLHAAMAESVRFSRSVSVNVVSCQGAWSTTASPKRANDNKPNLQNQYLQTKSCLNLPNAPSKLFSDALDVKVCDFHGEPTTPTLTTLPLCALRL